MHIKCYNMANVQLFDQTLNRGYIIGPSILPCGMPVNKGALDDI